MDVNLYCRCSNMFLFKKNKDHFPLKIAHSFHNSVRVLLSNFSRTTNRRQLCTLKQMTSPLNIIPYSLSRRGVPVIPRWGEDLSRGSIWWPSRDLLGHRSSTCTGVKRYSNSVINIVSRSRKGCVVEATARGWRGSVVLNAKHPSQHNSTVTSSPGFSELCLPYPYKHVYRFQRLCDSQTDFL